MGLSRWQATAIVFREGGWRLTAKRIGFFAFSRILLLGARWSPFQWDWAIEYLIARQSGDIASRQMVRAFLKFAGTVDGIVLVPDYLFPVMTLIQPTFHNVRLSFQKYSEANTRTPYAYIILLNGFFGPLVELVKVRKSLWFPIFGNQTFFILSEHSVRDKDWESLKTYLELQDLLETFLKKYEQESSEGALLGPMETKFFVRPQTIDSQVIGECMNDYIHWLKPRLSGKSQIVDIGGHIGGFSILVSKVVEPDSVIRIYEPSRDNFALIQKNLEANGKNNITAVRMAVSNRIGWGDLHLSADNTGGHRLHFPESNSPGSEAVEMTTLEEVFSHFPRPQIDVLKIDVEGSEQAILMACPELLANASVISSVRLVAPFTATRTQFSIISAS